jgi:hypothetical protein
MMKEILLFSVLWFPLWGQAHCPWPVQVNDQAYCVDVIWHFGEQKLQGQFSGSEMPSPHLVPMSEIPQGWIFSRASLYIWEQGDPLHQPVEIENFRVFPYMFMENGHHHSTGYEFAYDSSQEQYWIQRMAFQQMRGCWSLRWTTEPQDELETSQTLLNIIQFANLDEAQWQQQMAWCEAVGERPEGHGGHSHPHNPP